MNLITLEEALAHLRVDEGDDDDDIQRKIQEASGAILTYLADAPIGQPKRDQAGAVVRDEAGGIVYETGTDGQLIVRYEIKAACKLLLGELYHHREAQQDEEVQGQYGYGYLPRPVVALLYPLRQPAFA